MESRRQVRNNILLQIADLFLESESDTSDWVSVVPLRQSWYGLFLLAGIAVVWFHLIGPMFTGYLSASASATELFRVTGLFLFFGALVSLFFMTFNYYKYIIGRDLPVRLLNVLTFYGYAVLFFGVLYSKLYMIQPRAFVYRNPPFQVTATYGYHGLKAGCLLWIDFAVNSALQSLGGHYYRVEPCSIFASLLNWLQSLYSLSLLSLLIASYVNQRTRGRLSGRP